MLIIERHWETQALIDLFASMAENEKISYSDLAARCNTDVKSIKKRMNSARDAVLTDHHVIIYTLRGWGVERIPQQNVTVPVSKQRQRARNASRKGIKYIKEGVHDWDALPKDTRTQLFVEQAVLGATVLFTTEKSRKKLKDHVETTNAKLDIGRTLELLK